MVQLPGLPPDPALLEVVGPTRVGITDPIGKALKVISIALYKSAIVFLGDDWVGCGTHCHDGTQYRTEVYPFGIRSSLFP